MKKFKIAKISDEIYKNNNYQKTNYTGLSKILYYFNHKLLNLFVEDKYNEHIVEIGGGAKPHINYMNTEKIKKYTIIDSLKYQKKINELKKKYKNINFELIDYKKKYQTKKKFSRMIASHSFEHIKDFENQFIKNLSILKKNSIISIALPCDPGLFWRCLQYIIYFKQKKYYGWKSFKEKDLSHARDHCTPVQNIQKVINYYFEKQKNIYFPFFIPSINFNIFLIIQIKTFNLIKNYKLK